MSNTLVIPRDLWLDNPLWNFAGRFWSGQTAQVTALALQDRGWKITDILCALWLALQGRRFDGMSAERVLAWRRGVTEALRSVRKTVSKDNPATDLARQCIARSELEAEKVELALTHRALLRDEQASVRPDAVTLKTLALENLQAAAPENKAMDEETGRLLATLTTELQIFAEKERSSC